MAAGRRGFDPRLALHQPIWRDLELVLVDIAKPGV
jgi:hypothetical protein